MADSNQKRDNDLIKRTLDGDKNAFRSLVEAYQSRIFTLVFHMCHDHQEAEDLTQETFLRAYRGLKRFQFKSEFYTWIYRIAVNVSLNHIRQAKKRKAIPQEALPKKVLEDHKSSADPAKQAEAHELYKHLLEGMEQLSPDLKSTLVLFVFQGLTHKQAAEVLGVAEGTVAWRINEARQQLRRHLKEVRRPKERGNHDGLQRSQAEDI